MISQTNNKKILYSKINTNQQNETFHCFFSSIQRKQIITLLYISFLKLSSSSFDCNLFSRSTLESVSCSRAYLADSRESLSSWHSFFSSSRTDSRLLASLFTTDSCASFSESFLCDAFNSSSVFLCAATSFSNLRSK